MQASPLTRIRLVDWHFKCLEKPELLNSPDPFTITIPRSVGAIVLTHKKITLASTLLPPNPGRRSIEDEIAPLVAWLTDPGEAETDIWGVVALKVEDDIVDTIIGHLFEASSNTAKKIGKSIQEVQSSIASSFKSAQELADNRVKRALQQMYNVVRQTNDHMKRNNLGVYSPSYAEALALHAIAETVKSREIQDVQAKQLMHDALGSLRA
jgi:hypothetical protein